MPNDIFLSDERPRQFGFSFLPTALFVIIFLAVCSWFGYTKCLIDVPPERIAILISKDGKDLKNSDEIAPSAGYRGVQRELLTVGRHFRNPYYWDWEIHPEEVIEKGKLGIKVSLTGDDLPYGEYLAHVDEQGNATTKGIVPGVLRDGRYTIHPYLYEVLIEKPISVPAGFKGVVTNLSGELPDNPNMLVVPSGKRGVQEESLGEGTYFVNKYEKRINLVDCRSQRFNLAENKDMGFPSKDGFWVSLDGIIEFHVMPEKAAEVYVTYNDEESGVQIDAIDEEIIRKVILPNARSFCRLQGSNKLGVDFIQGTTRSQFQEDFQTAMRNACEPLGIEIIQALITNIRPPQKIAEPVREREIAKQQEKQYQQQILQQESEKNLAIEAELVEQKQALVQAEQSVVKVTIDAKREQEVDVTEAEQRLAVAQYNLDAAKDQAAAIVELGKAEAEVVGFENKAAAAGWKKSVEAFHGDGGLFAEYVLFQKMSAAYREIMVNTADSPIMRVFESFGSAREKTAPVPSVKVENSTAESK